MDFRPLLAEHLVEEEFWETSALLRHVPRGLCTIILSLLTGLCLAVLLCHSCEGEGCLSRRRRVPEHAVATSSDDESDHTNLLAMAPDIWLKNTRAELTAELKKMRAASADVKKRHMPESTTPVPVACRAHGTLERFFPAKGYGFIKPADGTADVFYYAGSAVNGKHDVSEGDEVTYVRQPGHRTHSWQAFDVRSTGKKGPRQKSRPAVPAAVDASASRSTTPPFHEASPGLEGCTASRSPGRGRRSEAIERSVEELHVGDVVSGKVTRVDSEKVWVDLGMLGDASFWANVGSNWQIGDIVSNKAIARVNLTYPTLIELEDEPRHESTAGPTEDLRADPADAGSIREEASGTLARWFADRGFGFVKPDDGSNDIFFQARALVDADGRLLKQGDRVVFKKFFNERKGKDAVEDVRRAGVRNAEAGTLVNWFPEKGFGFIHPDGDDARENIFVHARHLLDRNNSSFREGERVTFQKQFNNRRGKYQAYEVHATGEMDRTFSAEIGAGLEGGNIDEGSGLRNFTGTITRFIADKGFGFLHPDDGSEDIFFHARTFLDGEGNVRIGDKVTFRRQQNKWNQRYEAADVRTTGEVDTNFTLARSGPLSDGPGVGAGTHGTGILSHMLQDKGFGFIQPDGGGHEIFCHVRSFAGIVQEGDTVSYKLEYKRHKGKMEAADVRTVYEHSDEGEDSAGDDAMSSQFAGLSICSFAPHSQGLSRLLRNCTSAEELNLASYAIEDVDAELIAEVLPGCRNLAALDLSNNLIGNAGAVALARALPGCERLKELRIRWNNVENAGAQALVAALSGCGALRVLDMAWNKIGVSGTEALGNFTEHCQDLKVEYEPQLYMHRT